MPGKRKRVEDTGFSTLENGKKPMSAIAAARIKAEAAIKSLQTSDIVQPPDVPLDTPEPGYENVDTTEVDDEESKDENGSHVEHSFKLCNWQNDSKDILSDTDAELTINLKKHTTVALIGCFQFAVLKGAVHLFGANISAIGPAGQKDTTYHTCVPATHPILQIRGLDGLNRVRFRTCKEPVPLAGVNPLFANIWQAKSDDARSRSFSIVTESSDDLLSRALVPESTPELWLQAIEDCTARPSITLIIGSVDSGKSTLAKRISNRFLTGMGKSVPAVSTVAYLDLNPRKQEYAPHGQVSLVMMRDLNLGPAFTHPAINPGNGDSKRSETIRAHPIPLNLADYMDYYYTCVDDLFLAYQSLHSCDPSLPLIIDMPSFLYDSDFDLLTRLITRIRPQHLVHLSARRDLDNSITTKLDSLGITSTQCRTSLHQIGAHTNLSAPVRTATELGTIHMQSYFHLKPNKPASSEAHPPSWTSTPLSNQVPWEFCYQETDTRHQDFVGFATYTNPIDPASLIHALNGSIVHIIQSTSSRIPTPYTTLTRDSKHHLPYLPESKETGMIEPLDPRTSRLVCTAMIRGFDLEQSVVQVLVPETHQELLYGLVPEQTVFVYGCCETPEWAYVEDAYARVSQGTSGNSKSGTQKREVLPWVADTAATRGKLGYLNTKRRVRKFQT